MLLCTAYDGDWDPYIDDFARLVPDLMDFAFEDVEGWPGIRDPSIKNFIAQHQVTAAGWFCAYPDATIDVRRSQRITKAFDELLDAAQG